MSDTRRVAGMSSLLAMLAAGLVIMFALPQVMGLFGIVQMTVFVAMAMFALSQGFLWGFGGIMSFGQAAFFGIGGYAYAVAAINMGESTVPVLISVVAPMLFAALLGYFMFYGRISDAYIGVITLTVSVILFELINSTSGSAYHIGSAELGGFNGIPSVPPLNFPGDPDSPLDPDQAWYAAMGSLIAAYLFLRLLLASKFGRVVVAIRENETRAMLLGYDPRLYKLLTFVIAAGVAGLAGCLFTNWGAFISPTVFGLTMSAQVIIFVLVGGLGTLLGPILGAVGIEYLIILAGSQDKVNSNLGLGIVLVAFVLLVPQGIVPTIRDRLLPARRPARTGSPAADVTAPAEAGKARQ